MSLLYHCMQPRYEVRGPGNGDTAYRGTGVGWHERGNRLALETPGL